MQAARGLGGASVWAGDGARNGRARGQGETRGCGARVERTTNMASMVVTLDVLLKFSGWLNADASCPAKGRAYEVGSTRAGRRERVGRWRCEERGVRASKGRPEGAGHGPSAPETCPPWW